MASKINDRLTRAVEAAQPQMNRSPSLVPLKTEYEKFKTNLKFLVVLVNKYADSTSKMQSSRDELVKHLGLMSKQTPIYKQVGKDLEGETEGQALIQIAESEIDSLCIVQRVASAQAEMNAQEYFEHIISYAEEWDKVVTRRIDRELKNVRKLQNDRSHYEKKVENLRQRVSDLQEKGKPNLTQEEKLIRNEAKLKEAYNYHEEEADKLCTLIEAATYDGWKDLYTFVKNLMKWESNRVGRESDIYSHMAHLLESMKASLKVHKNN